MAGIAANTLLQYLHTLMAGQKAEGQSDQHLLEKFVSQRDELAFAALLERHGPMVLGVCRRILHDEYLAEDAFQATYLVLARKAGSIRKQQSVASWLHGVALRLARKAQAMAIRSKRADTRDNTAPAPDPQVEVSWREVQEILDDELEQLPDKHRLPLVLCYLEGRTRDEAAAQLGWTPGKLKGLLERGRERLRSRLIQRGVSLSIAGSATLLADTVLAATVPPLLAVATVQAAARFAGGAALAACGISDQVVALVEGALQTMALSKAKIIVTALLVFALCGVGFGTFGIGQPPAPPGKENKDKKPAPPANAASDKAVVERPLRIDGKIVFDKDGKAIMDRRTIKGRAEVAKLAGFFPALGQGNKSPISGGWKAAYTIKFDRGKGEPLTVKIDSNCELWSEGQGDWDANAGLKNFMDMLFKQDAKNDKERDQTDALGDPLPSGAILRLGTDRFTHQGAVYCTSFSPDGKTLASGGGYYDDTVRLWEPATGKEILRLKHGGPVRGLAWSADGKLLVTASDTDGIRFWEIATGKLVRHFPEEVGRTFRLALSRDGKTLAVGESVFKSSDAYQLLRLRDASTGKELHRFKVARAYNVSFSLDGQTVALGGEEKKIRLWEVSTGKELPSLEEHGGGTYAVAFSPNGKLLASGGTSPDPSTYLWEWPSGRLVHRLDTHEYGVYSIRFSPDGNTIATGSGNPNGIIHLWDVTTGKEIRQLKGHRSPIHAFSFSADGKKIASTGSWERTVRIWDVADAKECSPFARHQGEVEAVAFAPDGLTLATASRDQTVAFWKTATGQKAGELLGHRGRVNAVAYSPDGQLVATGSDDKTVRLWRAATGKELHSFQGHENGVTTISFSPDGRTLASGVGGDTSVRISGMRRPDGAVWLWDIATGKARHRLEAKTGRVHSVAYSPDGRVLASAGPDEEMIHLWDPTTGKAIRKFQSAGEPATPPSMAEGITRIAFSPDGKTLASVSRYRFPDSIRLIDDKKTHEVRTVRLWEVATGKERLQIRMPIRASDSIRDERRNEVTCVAFSADGQMLILGKKEGDIALWHIPAGKQLRLQRGHQDLVTAIALAPDGKTFASASEDTTVLLWNATALHDPWKTRITAKDRDSHWADLASPDAARAYQAVWALAGAPQETVSFLKESLRPVPKVEAGKVARWIEAMDDNRFAQRDEATRELGKLADVAVPDLRRALSKPRSVESRRRLEELLARWGRPDLQPPPDSLQALRALEVLEHLGNPQAQQVLQALADGAAGARLTREARAALERLVRK